jgi:hypothetical protein
LTSTARARWTWTSSPAGGWSWCADAPTHSRCAPEAVHWQIPVKTAERRTPTAAPPRLTASAVWVPAQDGAQREEAVGKARALVLAPATLECTVVSARKLKKMDRLKGNDVFCVLIVDDDPQRTSTIW